MVFTEAQLVEAFTYLDELRLSGITNMFGSAKYVQDDLEYNKRDAFKLVELWMKSYNDTSAKVRAKEVFAEV